MIRLKALTGHESDESDESQSASVQKPCTKEAQEADAFSLYNQALLLVKEGQLEDAKRVFFELLDFKLLKEAVPSASTDEGLVHPGLVLKYSVYKNLATISLQNEHIKDSLEYYLQAVLVDSTEVSVWFKIGILAIKLDNISLAKHAFQQGLNCNPNHWPSLQNLIPVLYALSNYQECLAYTAIALERDPGYLDGKVFLHNIYAEQPSLRRHTADLFKNCCESIYDYDSDTEKAANCLDEALLMRKKRQDLGKQPPLESIEPKESTFITTWKSLGETLLDLYKIIEKSLQNESKPKYRFSQRVDLHALTSPSTPGPDTQQTDDKKTTHVKDDNPTDKKTSMDVEMEQDQAVPASETKINQPMTAENQNNSDPVSGGANVTPKRGKKRRFQSMTEDYIGKRRSARVRNTAHKKDETVDYHQLLAKFLPLSLLEVQDLEDDSSSLPSTAIPGKTQLSTDLDTYQVECLTKDEGHLVQEFIEKHHINSGVLDLLQAYLIELALKSDKKWPPGVAAVYINVYKKLRKHITLPDYLCKEVSNQMFKNLGMICLVYCELEFERTLSDKERHSLQARSPGDDRPSHHHSADDLLGHSTQEDLIYISGLAFLRDILEDTHLNFIIRVSWLKARYLFMLGDMYAAVDWLYRTQAHLKQLVDVDKNPSILLPNCEHDNLITLVNVEKQLESLAHCQSLEEVHKLYECGAYDKVVELLLKTFSQDQVSESNRDDRYSQLLLLQDSLLHLKDYKQCVIWSEVSLNETMKRYFSATSLVKQKWLNTLVQLMEGLEKCFSSNPEKSLELPSKSLVRLTHNLIRLIQKTMDAPSSALQMSIPTLLPWILLYRLVKNEEMCFGSEKFLVDDAIPCSLTFLNIAHDCLGRRSWCAQCNGQLLHFTLDILMDVLASSTPEQPLPYEDNVRTGIEQCVYCLYNHPSKRTKAKHLEDHNTEGVPLEWKRAAQLFNYFKPTSMPEYDSYRTSTVSAELENLLRRVSSLVPSNYTPPIASETISAYIEGSSSKPPSLPEGQQTTMPVVEQLFYLLADYYFKNKEPMKAIKFYIQDLCYNPTRFDSWAGMALARSIRIEQKLASHELRPEVSLQKQAVCTLRCFKRALQLDPSSSKLWIEYGSIAYQLHSFASRQCKQRDWHMYSKDQLELAASNKKDMLELACTCYNKAATIEEGEEAEEQWLHHYMLGKITEKQGKHPNVYLDHYKLAAHYLHEDRAKYPRKITFYHTAPHLAIEALEMHYRLHVSILKYLLTHKEDEDLPLDLLQGYVKDAACGPFATYQEMTSVDIAYSDDGSHSNTSVTPVASEVTKKKRRVHQSIPDHTYSKEKQTSESELSSHGSDLHNSSQDSMYVSDVSPELKSTTAQQPRPSTVDASDKKTDVNSVKQIHIIESADHQSKTESSEQQIQAQECSMKMETESSNHSSKAKSSDHAVALCDSNECKVEAESSDNKIHSKSSNQNLLNESTAYNIQDDCFEANVQGKYSGNNLHEESFGQDWTAELSDHVIQAESSHPKQLNESSEQSMEVEHSSHEMKVESPNTGIWGNSSQDDPLQNSIAAEMPEHDIHILSSSPKISSPLEHKTQAELPSEASEHVMSTETNELRSAEHSIPVESSEHDMPDEPCEYDLQAESTEPSIAVQLSEHGMATQSSENEIATKSSECGMPGESSEQKVDLSSCPDDQLHSSSYNLLDESSDKNIQSEFSDHSVLYESSDSDVQSLADLDLRKESSGQDVSANLIQSAEISHDPANTRDKMTSPTNVGKRASQQEQKPAAVQISETLDQSACSCGMPELQSSNFTMSSSLTSASYYDVDTPIGVGTSNQHVKPYSSDSDVNILQHQCDESPPTLTSCTSHVTISENDNDYEDSIDLDPPILDKPFLELTYSDEDQRDSHSSNDGVQVSGDDNEDAAAADAAAAADDDDDDVNILYVDGAGDEKPVADMTASDSASTQTSTVNATEVSSAATYGTTPSDIALSSSTAATESKLVATIQPAVFSCTPVIIDSTNSASADTITVISSMVSESSVVTINSADQGCTTLTGSNLIPSQVVGHSESCAFSSAAPIDSKVSVEKATNVSDSTSTVLHLQTGADSGSVTMISTAATDCSSVTITSVPATDSNLILPTPTAVGESKPVTSSCTAIDSSSSAVTCTTISDSNTAVVTVNTARISVQASAKQNYMEVDGEAKPQTTKDGFGGKDTKKDVSKESVADVDKTTVGSQKVVSRQQQYRDLVDSCMKALALCLQRLPQHHKSLYRLAYVYMHCPHLKNAEYAQDLLLGNPNWSNLSHMPCPGMFQERKQNNFFQGLWKIPIDEIDRSGSFAAHLTVSIVLLYKVLEERKQSHTLYHIHLQLNRTPDTGRKYIRDCDRVYLAKDAFKKCAEVLKRRASKKSEPDESSKQNLLMEVYKVWLYGVRQRMCAQTLNEALVSAYKMFRNIDTGEYSAMLDEAIKYCQHRSPINKPVHESRRESQDILPMHGRQHEMSKTQSNISARPGTSGQTGSSQQTAGHQSEDGSTKPSSGDLSTEELLAQYQQKQLDMMSTLAHLYGQSNYMAYASNLQALASGLYEGYNLYGMSGLSAMTPPLAQTLLPNSMLGAPSGGFLYPGYPLTPDMLAALSQAPATQRSPNRSSSLDKKLAAGSLKKAGKPYTTTTAKHGSVKLVQKAGCSRSTTAIPSQKLSVSATSGSAHLSKPLSKPRHSNAGDSKGHNVEMTTGFRKQDTGRALTLSHGQSSVTKSRPSVYMASRTTSGISQVRQHVTGVQNRQPGSSSQSRLPTTSSQAKHSLTLAHGRLPGFSGQVRQPGSSSSGGGQTRPSVGTIRNRQSATASLSSRPSGSISQVRQSSSSSNQIRQCSVTVQSKQAGAVMLNRQPGTSSQARQAGMSSQNRQPGISSQSRQASSNNQRRQLDCNTKSSQLSSGNQSRSLSTSSGMYPDHGIDVSRYGSVKPSPGPVYEDLSPDSDVVIISSSQDSSD